MAVTLSSIDLVGEAAAGDSSGGDDHVRAKNGVNPIVGRRSFHNGDDPVIDPGNRSKLLDFPADCCDCPSPKKR